VTLRKFARVDSKIKSFNMKKHYFFTGLLIAAGIFSVNGQSISPDVNGIYCPNQDVTFSVTLPLGSTSYVSSLSGTSVSIPEPGGAVLNTAPATVVSAPTNITFPGGTSMKFDFIGRFQDNNTPQSFLIICYNGSAYQNFYFTYNKIESFSPANVTVSRPVPTPSSITANPCETNTFSINFPNVQFSNNVPNASVSYGTVTQYQYLLPSGWSLGSTVSNGTDWLIGSNSVTVTADATHGDGSYVSIQAINPCSGNSPGPIAQIPISRPAPALSVTTTETGDFCTGTRTYTINGMPTGASVSWSVSNNFASIPAGSNSQSVIVTKGTGNGFTTLTATVTNCGFTYSASKDIGLGVPPPIIDINATCPFVAASVSNVIAGNNFNWYKNGVLNSSQHSHVYSFQQFSGSSTICVNYHNTCGTSSQDCGIVDCSTGGFMSRASVAPNPGSGVFIVSAVADNPNAKTGKASLTGQKIYDIRILNESGVVQKAFRYPQGITSVSLNLGFLKNGVYIIQTFDKTNWKSSKVVIQQ
jgi:hypothetical protein